MSSSSRTCAALAARAGSSERPSMDAGAFTPPSARSVGATSTLLAKVRGCEPGFASRG